MKIVMRDLEQTILDKLNQLDNVAKTYDENHPEGVISYNKNGFYFKKTNDTLMKKVYDENELVELEKALYSDSKNITTTYREDIRNDGLFNYATKSFLHNVKFDYVKDFGAKINIYKSFGNALFILTDNGYIHRQYNNTLLSANILEILENNFNLTKKIFVSDIVDIELLDLDSMLIATSNFGVFKFSLISKEANLLFVVNSLRKIKLTETKTIFVISDEFCGQYDLVSGNRLEKYSNIYNRHQIPVDVDNIDGNMFVLGIPTGLYNLDNILHLWKLDDGRVAYNNVDAKIEKIKLDNRYQIMFVCHDNKNIYISGLFENSPFIITLDKVEYRILSKKVYTDVVIDEFTDIRALEGNFFILSKDRLYVLDSEGVEETLKLEEACQRVKVFNGEVVAVAGSKLVKFQLLKYEKKTDTLSYLVLDEEEPCNNIDILIKGASRAERVILIDAETGKEIIPSFYMVFKGNSVIKLMNSKIKKIILKLSVSPTSKVEGIVLRRNRMFLR